MEITKTINLDEYEIVLVLRKRRTDFSKEDAVVLKATEDIEKVLPPEPKP